MKAAKYTIAIDLGGTIIKIGLLSYGKLIDRCEVKAQSAKGLKIQLPELKSTIDFMLNANSIAATEILGIGFSFAGLVDSNNSRVISTNQKYDDGPDIDLVEWAKRNWDVPLFAENDARMALLGEWQSGAGQGCNNLVMVTLGTGIGSAVLIEGNLLKGKHFQAGNLGGHFTVNHRGSRCTCGSVGCMEAEASTWRLPELIQSHPKFHESRFRDEEIPDYKTLFRLASENDIVAQSVVDHCLSVWAAGIITMIHAFDPEKIIIGGGIMKSAAHILPALQTRIDEQAWTPWGKVQLIEAAYPDSAALFGADFLVRQNLQPQS